MEHLTKTIEASRPLVAIQIRTNCAQIKTEIKLEALLFFGAIVCSAHR